MSMSISGEVRIVVDWSTFHRRNTENRRISKYNLGSLPRSTWGCNPEGEKSVVDMAVCAEMESCQLPGNPLSLPSNPTTGEALHMRLLVNMSVVSCSDDGFPSLSNEIDTFSHSTARNKSGG